jgi:hypothetical protein
MTSVIQSPELAVASRAYQSKHMTSSTCIELDPSPASASMADTLIAHSLMQRSDGTTKNPP